MTLSTKTLIDVNANGNTYYGEAVAGGATSEAIWQIQRKSTSGTIDTYLWANGKESFTNIWDDRTSLTYI